MSRNYQLRPHRVGDRTFDQQQPAVADETAELISQRPVMLFSSCWFPPTVFPGTGGKKGHQRRVFWW